MKKLFEGKTGAIIEDAKIERWAKAFDPSRIKLSGKMRAILGALLGRVWTEPALIGLRVTNDDFVMGQYMNDVGANVCIGFMSSLESNIRGAAQIAIDDEDDREGFVNWALAKTKTGFETLPSSLRGTFTDEEAEIMKRGGVIISDERVM